MTSSAQFKTWLDANTLYQSRQRAWAGRLYNPAITAWYPNMPPPGSQMMSYRTREKSPYEPFQGFYEHGETLVAEKREKMVREHEEAFRKKKRSDSRAGHGKKYFKSPEEQESDEYEYRYGTGYGNQRVEPKVRWNRT